MLTISLPIIIVVVAKSLLLLSLLRHVETMAPSTRGKCLTLKINDVHIFKFVMT